MRAFEVGRESGHVLDMQTWGRRQSMNKAAVVGAKLTACTTVPSVQCDQNSRWGVTAQFPSRNFAKHINILEILRRLAISGLFSFVSKIIFSSHSIKTLSLFFLEEHLITAVEQTWRHQLNGYSLINETGKASRSDIFRPLNTDQRIFL